MNYLCIYIYIHNKNELSNQYNCITNCTAVSLQPECAHTVRVCASVCADIRHGINTTLRSTTFHWVRFAYR